MVCVVQIWFKIGFFMEFALFRVSAFGPPSAQRCFCDSHPPLRVVSMFFFSFRIWFPLPISVLIRIFLFLFLRSSLVSLRLSFPFLHPRLTPDYLCFPVSLSPILRLPFFVLSFRFRSLVSTLIKSLTHLNLPSPLHALGRYDPQQPTQPVYVALESQISKSGGSSRALQQTSLRQRIDFPKEKIGSVGGLELGKSERGFGRTMDTLFVVAIHRNFSQSTVR